MLLDALDHLRVLVADVDVDLLAGEVEHFTAVAVLQPHAVTGYHFSGIQVALCRATNGIRVRGPACKRRPRFPHPAKDHAP